MHHASRIVVVQRSVGSGAREDQGRTLAAGRIAIRLVSRPTLAAALLLATAGLPYAGLAGDVRVVERPVLKTPPSDYRAKYAIIIGIDDYSQGEGFPRLQNAANDAREFRKLLVEEFGYTKATIRYLTDAAGEPEGIADGPPTLAAIKGAFAAWLPGRGLRPDDSVLFFFAGHGVRDGPSGEAYIAASDSKARDSGNTCLRVGWIRDRLGEEAVIPCRHKLVLLDCCFSGGLFMFDQPLAARPVPMASGGLPKQSAAAVVPPGATRGVGSRPGRGGDDISYYLRGEAFVGMTAGLGDQPVSDGTGDARHSLFTNELLRAMRERADSTRTDHIFTFTELSSYLRPRLAAEILKRDTLSNQIPMAGRIEAGEGDFVFRQTRNREVPWERAEREARESESRRLAALVADVAGSDPLDLVMLLALESLGRADTEQARRSLQLALNTRPEIARILHVPGRQIRSVAFGPDGRIAAGIDTYPGGVVLFDRSGQPLTPEPLPVTEGGVRSVAFGPEGKLAAAFDHGVVVFDASGKRLTRDPMKVMEGDVWSVAFGPDGRIAAGFSGLLGPGVVVFDASGNRLTPRPLAVERGPFVVRSVAFGPEGKLAAAFDRGVVVFGASGKRLTPQPLAITEGIVRSVAFGHDGKLAAAFGGSPGDGVVYGARPGPSGVVLFDASGKRLTPEPLAITEGEVMSVAFDSDGKLAAGFYNGALGSGVMLFGAQLNRLRREPLAIAEGVLRSVAFGPDGKLAAGFSNFGGEVKGCVVFFDADPASWRRKAEQVANRNLTKAEWSRYFSDTPYRRTIRSLP